MTAAAAGPRSSFIGDLRTVLGSSGFRKLFATRLISQTGDGMFQAGIAAYVFFSATTFPDAADAAISLALLYLPYSLIGPFAGVFIDRWSRRQILLWSAVLRAGFAGLTAVFIITGILRLPVWLAALVVLGVNRFFLSSLSAALPHVAADDELVMANSVSVTSGTLVAFIGGITGIGVRLVTGPGAVQSAITLLAAGLCYLLAGLSATRMAKTSLGPDLGPSGRLRSVATELVGVAVGMAEGLRHIWHRRQARAALAATGTHRFLYGILLLMSILLYRNYFYPGGGGNEALKHYLPVVISAAFGYGAAAWLTPIVTRRISNTAWITMLLASGGIVAGTVGLTFGQVEFNLIAFWLGVVAQGVNICTTTILQQGMDDDFRGRVFSVNDTLFNVTYVLGAVLSAIFLPVTGRSVPMLLVVGCGYLVAAGVYLAMVGQPPRAAQPPLGSSAGPPDSRAQRSSS